MSSIPAAAPVLEIPRRRDLHRPARPRTASLARVARVTGWLLVVLVIAAGAASKLGLIGMYTVSSGSMQPSMEVGDLVAGRSVPADSVDPGDVVTVVADDGRRITHRVVALAPTGGGAAVLTLAGDANQGPDAERYDLKTVITVDVHVPRVGLILGYGLPRAMPWLIGSILVGAAWSLTRARPRASRG